MDPRKHSTEYFQKPKKPSNFKHPIQHRSLSFDVHLYGTEKPKLKLMRCVLCTQLLLRRVPTRCSYAWIKLIDEEIIRDILRPPGLQPPPYVVICGLILQVKVQIVRFNIPKLHLDLHRVAEAVLIRDESLMIIQVNVILLQLRWHLNVELNLIECAPIIHVFPPLLKRETCRPIVCG